MAKLIITYWRDIPAQVTAKAGRKTAKIQLTDRFQEAIDMAAMRAGKDGTDAYLEDWRREQSECDDDLQAVVKARAQEIEDAFTTEVLQAVVKNYGVIDKADD
ncbi:MAG: virulence factor [Pseudomonadota bacterium]